MGAQAELADRLGEAVNGHPELVASVVPQLEGILRAPEDVTALVAAIDAAGHAWDPRAVVLLLDLVDPAHPDGQLRLSLAQALQCGSDDEPVRDRVIDVLIPLTRDELGDVRDWACFGLGQLEADSLEARDALAARLDDEHVDARQEALFALATLRDQRARAACARELADPDAIGLLVLRAAAALAEPSLLPLLNDLADEWAADDDCHTQALALAVEACSPPDGPG
jgi:HEAT repeat protein